MSLALPDYFSDLLCGEDAGALADNISEYSPDLDFPADIEDSIAVFLEDERDYTPGSDYRERFRSLSLDAPARQASVAWILKVHAFFRFQPLTAYLSVNYLDRFLSSHRLPQANGWPLQLLSVACLSLAAKMEETLVPSLLDLQVMGAKFIFEPRTIRRMEFLVLSALNWRLRSITPFNFIDFFAYKFDPSGTFVRFLVSRATQIILATTQGIDFLEYWASSIASAALLCAADEIPNMSLMNPGNTIISWCVGLSKERIVNCYQLMQQVVVGNRRRKRPKILPHQLRVETTPTIMASPTVSSSNKRRKLRNFLPENDTEEDDDDHDDDEKKIL